MPARLGGRLGGVQLHAHFARIGEDCADALLEGSVKGLAPGVFVGYAGLVNRAGEAQAEIRIPKAPALIGLMIHTAAVTLDATAASGVRAITNTFSFQIAAK